ncbi:ribosome silencing factor [Xylophilus sp. Leaf220]|uniref:ribosome silencing factor n=1 Tax=Xylophilus sp. Leaf220 TaxID=1735686 RepID=UPI00070235A8|nr:ribosome silencing factor [Xylophilus sp. Leaf220]KQM75365.1 hypothetical protein ASE76_05265 [Xylophilus sp. Leaf220]
MSTTKTETTAKKDVQKLQRAIVDGLEDVKAQDIQVFNTENLSPLFERVIVASGSSNRQTKALAASVRDAVREAGFGKPRVEGEDNGEWIIVDCGPAVAHIMQPAIRQYYHLEELWGETPVRLKLGAAKPAQPEAKPKRTRKAAAAPEVAARKPGKPSVKAATGAAKTAAGKTAAAKTPAAKAPATRSTSTRPAAVKAVKTAAVNVPAKKVVAKKAPAKSVAGQDAKPMQVLVVKPTVRPPSKSAAAAAPRARPSAKTAGRAAAAKTASPTAAAKKPSRATSSKPAPKKWSRI